MMGEAIVHVTALTRAGIGDSPHLGDRSRSRLARAVTESRKWYASRKCEPAVVTGTAKRPSERENPRYSRSISNCNRERSERTLRGGFGGGAVNPADLDHVILAHVNQKAQALEDVIGSDVVSYFGQIVPQIARPFRNFIEEVRSKSKRTEGALSIVLRSPGGSAEATERLVSIVRHNYTTVNFIVPDHAMSAGTIFCMSGDKIFMDYSSALGPIDPQVLSSDGVGYVAALGYLDKVQEITAKKALSPADVVFLKSLDLGKLALFEQAKNLSISLLKRWLVAYKFKDWTHHRTNNPGQPVTSAEKEARAEEIAAALSDNKRWHMHGRALGIDRLKELRLDIDDYSANDPLRTAIREYSDLLTAYVDRMKVPSYLHSHHTETP